MREYARGTTGGALASSPITLPAPAPADRVALLSRTVDALEKLLVDLERAHAANAPERWHDVRQQLDAQLAHAGRMRDVARDNTASDQTLGKDVAVAATRLDSCRVAASTKSAPTGIASVAREAELLDILGAPIAGPVAAAYRQKEVALRGAARLRANRPTDSLAARFSALTAERRHRLRAVLDDARRRAAVQAERLPFQRQIQASFGRHDVSSVDVQVGGAAGARAIQLGARAFTTGNLVAFREPPDLHTAAHEAAHVIQQRQGCSAMDVTFVRCDLRDTIWRDRDLFRVRFVDCKLAGVSGRPIFNETTFERADVSPAGDGSELGGQREALALWGVDADQPRAGLTWRDRLFLPEAEFAFIEPQLASLATIVISVSRHDGMACADVRRPIDAPFRTQIEALLAPFREANRPPPTARQLADARLAQDIIDVSLDAGLGFEETIFALLKQGFTREEAMEAMTRPNAASSRE